MQSTTSLATLVCLSLSLLGCTTTGTGGGQLTGNGAHVQAVTFSWSSTDGGLSGLMTAQLPDVRYQGQFFQITEQTRAEVLTPLWTHWNRGWHDWPYRVGPIGPPDLTYQFITHYSGRVVATLAATGKQNMRCRFHLAVPVRGMSGGGDGECQLTDGRVVQAVFPGK